MHDNMAVGYMIIRVIHAIMLLTQVGKFKFRIMLKNFFAEDHMIVERACRLDVPSLERRHLIILVLS